MSKRTRKPESNSNRKQSESVYAHRGPTNTHSLGFVRNHDSIQIPSSTFRTLEQTIPRDQLRTHEEYRGYNPRTGKSKWVKEPNDLLAHAQRSIASGKFPTVTSGYRQRYEHAEAKASGKEYGKSGAECYPCAPSALGGSLGSRRKDRY